MQPNINVYGAAETWLHRLPLSGYNEDNENFVPAWEDIHGGITAGKLVYNTSIDSSICFAGIANDAPVAGVYTFSDNSYQSPLHSTFDKENFIITYADPERGNVRELGYYDLTDDPFTDLNCYSPVESILSNNPNYYLQPMCSISPKDFVMCVYVVAYDTTYTNVVTETYEDYIASHTATNPHIIQVYATLYSRGSGSNTRSEQDISIFNFGGVTFSRLDPFKIPTFGDIKDYAASGIRKIGYIQILLWGLAESGGRSISWDSSNYIHRAYGEGTIKKSGSYLFMEHDYTGDDWPLRVAASYGLFFTTNTTAAANAAYNSPDMYLGTLDSDNLCHGDYTKGTANEDQPQYDWDSTNSSEYKPDQPVDPNQYSRTTRFNTIGNLATMNKRYVLNGTGVAALLTDLWTISGEFITNPIVDTTYEERVIDNFLTNNPIDCIIKLERYPLNNIPRADTLPRNIKFGRVEGQTAGYIMPYTSMQYDFKSIDVWPRFGNSFLDYNPYTVMELYIPFCGTVQLDPSDFIYRNLGVRMYIDFTTGTCTAYILSNDLVVKSVNGECSIQIPVNGTDSATMASQISNAIIQERKAYTTTAGTQHTDMVHLGAKYNALSGLWDPKGTVSSSGNNLSDQIRSRKGAAKQWDYTAAAYNLEHQIVPIHQIGGSTAATSWAIDLQCRLIFYYPTGAAIRYENNLPRLADLTQYAHLNGFATLANDILSKYHGYTVCSSVNTDSITATEAEKAQIIQLLTSGIYLPDTSPT